METRKQQHDDNQGTLPPERILVFFSYARRDQSLRDHLENHLSNLKYRGFIATWHSREISAGEELLHEIDIHLDSAHIILLLISANFLASQYCYGREMMQALERHKSGQAHVIPVLLRPVLFTDAPFANLQPLPNNGKPVTRWKDREEAFYEIARGIERLVLSLRAPVSLPALEQSARPSVRMSRTPAFAYEQRATLKRQRSFLPVLLGFSLILLAAILFFVGPALLSPRGSSTRPPFATPTPAPLPTPTPTPLPIPATPPSLGLVALLIVVGVFCLLFLLGVVIVVLRMAKRRRQAREARRREEARQQEAAQWREAARQREETQRREEVRRQEEARVYYARALSAYEQALQEDSTDVTATRGKGNALAALSRYDEALTAFEQAVALAPHPATFVSIGTVLARLGRGEEAVQAYEQALALDTTYAAAYTGLSEALSHLGRTQEAEQASVAAKQLGEED